MLTCPNCGFKNHEGALFCEACGAYFHTGGALATGALDVEVEPASAPRPSRFPTPAAGPTQENLSLILIDDATGRHFRVEPADQTALIGRSDRQAKVFANIDPTDEGGQVQGVSRRHARVHYADGSYLLEDLESLNGTYLNGHRLRPYLPEVLHDGDRLALGDWKLTVSLQVTT